MAKKPSGPLTVAQVAGMLDCSERAVRDMAAAGIFPGATQGKRREWSIPADEVALARDRPGKGRPLKTVGQEIDRLEALLASLRRRDRDEPL